MFSRVHSFWPGTRKNANPSPRAELAPLNGKFPDSLIRVPFSRAIVPGMERDRDLQRLKATVQWYTAKRLAIYAKAEGLPVAVVASQLVRLGLVSLDDRDEDRRKLARWEYVENWNVLRHIPRPGESKRVAVALEDHEIERVKEFAAGEFEDLFDRIQYFNYVRI